MEAHFEVRISYLDEALMHSCNIHKITTKIQRGLLRKMIIQLGTEGSSLEGYNIIQLMFRLFLVVERNQTAYGSAGRWKIQSRQRQIYSRFFSSSNDPLEYNTGKYFSEKVDVKG